MIHIGTADNGHIYLIEGTDLLYFRCFCGSFLGTAKIEDKWNKINSNDQERYIKYCNRCLRECHIIYLNGVHDWKDAHFVLDVTNLNIHDVMELVLKYNDYSFIPDHLITQEMELIVKLN